MRLQDVLKKCKIIKCAQIGFAEKHQTTYIITLKSLISKHVSSVKQVGYMDVLLISGKHMTLYGMRDCSQSYLL